MRRWVPLTAAVLWAASVSKWVPLLGLLAIPLYIGLKRLLEEDD